MTDWRDRAACAGIDTALFFPANEGPARVAAKVERAKAICRDCPVVDACHAYIMATEEPAHRHGIWAGLTPKEREALDKKRKRA